MRPVSKTARAHPNIALVKYWGKRNVPLNLPAVPSLSVTLDQFYTETTVTWGAERDLFYLNNKTVNTDAAQKVWKFLDLIDANRPCCEVHSNNNFPTAAGLASSASAFAALALAGSAAAQKQLSKNELSVLARQGSGSAARSLWGGWVEWTTGAREDGSDSHGFQLHSEKHWDICVFVAVVSDKQKPIGSTKAMLRSAETSPMYSAWVQTADADIEAARIALQNRELNRLGAVMEHSTQKMFATMMTSQPATLYWQPASIALIHKVRDLRYSGVPCWYTMDAGPNVKVICERRFEHQVHHALWQILEPFGGNLHCLGVGSDAALC